MYLLPQAINTKQNLVIAIAISVMIARTVLIDSDNYEQKHQSNTNFVNTFNAFLEQANDPEH